MLARNHFDLPVGADARAELPIMRSVWVAGLFQLLQAAKNTPTQESR